MIDTPFKLISDFFHVNQGVLCCEHAEQASSSVCLGGATGLLNKGGAPPLFSKPGGSNRLPVEFPQVQTGWTSTIIMYTPVRALFFWVQ